METIVKVVISDDDIIRTVEDVARSVFNNGYGANRGHGRIIAERAVNRALEQLDLSVMARDAVAAMARDTVEQAVRERLDRLARAAVKKALSEEGK